MDITDFTRPTPLIVDFLGVLKPGCALDIGAGHGRNSLYLAEKGWTVDALDTNTESLQYINELAQNKNLRVHTILHDIISYDTPKEYDAILCLMTLHFMNSHDIQLTIEWIKRHTKPGGIVAISGFSYKNKLNTRPYLFSKDEMARFFSDWTVMHYEDNSISSTLDIATQALNMFYVSRIVAKKPIVN